MAAVGVDDWLLGAGAAAGGGAGRGGMGIVPAARRSTGAAARPGQSVVSAA
ncbi:MAG: hypothetical protein M3068_07770 [Gemmatimonadota bacterium]|nr:hypothetical protein [Gemmatimonadota bacterium]